MGQSHGGRSLGTRSRYRGRRDEGPSTSAGTSARPSDDFPIRFSFQQIALATNFFRHRNLGAGGFGQVIEGRLGIASGIRTVAVKQLNQNGPQGTKEFLAEVLTLSLLRHPNIVNLVGYCSHEQHRIIIYELLRSGSLHIRLHALEPGMLALNWSTRMKIATGVAKAINYLHNEAIPPVIYRDVKSSNVLLDEEFNPKLSDFGLAKFFPETNRTDVSTMVVGTPAYVAPEYASTGKVSFKSDVYGYGVLLMEIMTGETPWAGHRGHGKESLVDLVRDEQNIADLADAFLLGKFPETIFGKVMTVALMCTQRDPDLRPSMADVVYAMEFLSSDPPAVRWSNRLDFDLFDDDAAETSYAGADRDNRSLQRSRSCG